MATELGGTLPLELLSALADPAFENLAVPLLTTDRQGFPHVALISFLEIVPYRSERLAFFVYSGSRTAIFLQRNRICTLVVACKEFVYYLKGKTHPLGQIAGVVLFLFTLQTALQDHPSDAEGPAFLTSGLRFQAPDAEMERRRQLRRKMADEMRLLLSSGKPSH